VAKPRVYADQFEAKKNAYLPAFQYLDKVTLDLPQADENVVAPPELLFRYHTWKRLVSKAFAQRPIRLQDFREFLSYAEEWEPRYWPASTADYANMVDKLLTTQIQDLSVMSLQELPLDVRMAFQGWMNYFKDGEAINQFKPTYAQVREFLIKNPNYARNYWINIVKNNSPDYLKGLTANGGNDETVVPQNELTSFLRVAVYNYFMSLRNPPRSARDDIKLNVKKQN